jgi:multicomponent Na+:H+ antiporter subunit F
VSSYLTGLALFLLATLVIGLVRVARGPAPADRMLGLQFSGTTSVAVLLVLAEVAADDTLRNVALVFALLSLLLLITFVSRTPSDHVEREE